jgi:uncharacterized protein
MEDRVTLSSLPSPLSWRMPPTDWNLSEAESLTITAGAVTDLFIDPQGGAPMLNAPRLLCPVEGDFLFSANVLVEFAAKFDAGVLLIWSNDAHWAKLCFEYSPHGIPMVVSVVTRGVSDDANGFEAASNEVWLRVARLGSAFAFHASTDGHQWELIRHFSLDTEAPIEIGLLAQSPTGSGCTATFDTVRFAAERLADIRNGE